MPRGLDRTGTPHETKSADPSAKAKQRRAPRIRKRLTIRFGTKDMRTGTGFTTNLSARGLGLVTHAVLPVGTHLSVELGLPDGRGCLLECVVAWAKAGVAQFRTPGSMGLQLTFADERFFQLIARLTGEEPTIVVAPAKPPQVMARPTPIPNLDDVPALVNPAGTSQEFAVDVLDLLPELRQPPPCFEDEGWFMAPQSDVAPVIADEPPTLPLRAVRLDEQLPIRFTSGARQSGKGFTLNLSRTGLALLTTTALMPDQQVSFAMTMADGLVCTGVGTVVWSRQERFGSGLHMVAGISLNYVDISYDELLDTLANGREVGAAE